MINLQHIEKIYNKGTSQEVRALKDISLQINKGEIFGVIGLSGAGKSTLIRIINLLERPSAGEVTVDGQNMLKLSPAALRQARRSIGMIFQSFNLLSSATVFNNVAFPLRLYGMSDENAIKKRVTELLNMVELSDKAEMYPAQLSGGQKQRVGIARALAADPKILLCDEATSALDPKTTSSILELLTNLRDRLGLTIVIITHQMEVIKECCDQVAVIDGGVITEMGSVIEIFTDPKKELTRRLVSNAVGRKLPDLLKDTKIRSEYAAGDKAVVELLFLGDKADSPVLVEVAEECRCKISILSGNIDHIKDQPFGLMLVEIAGDKETLNRAIAAFKRKVHKVEVLGYECRRQLSEC